MAAVVTSPSPFDNSSAPPISARPSLVSPSRRTSSQRPASFARNRLSAYSNVSNSQSRSRPTSHTFPFFQSSLPYASVRDFAYPANHPLHYGAPPKDSGISTPVSESRRLSDPPASSWDATRSQWPAPHWNPETMYGHQQLPAIAFGDGPPYSEDEDLQSPVVTTSRHRKTKSAFAGDARSASRKRRGNNGSGNDDVPEEDDRGVFIGVNGDGSETYFVKGDSTDENGAGGTYVTYPANESRHSYLAPGSFEHDGVRDSHFAAAINDRSPYEREFELESDDEISDEEMWNDPSRYSRNYQFTIVSPDEEMHGKAVALFDFTREHENELPLKEGQVILVSYRHGQGWLVAEDPRTGESGLVPEEFVRLVRDIEGGLTSLNGDLGPLLDDSSNAIEIETTPESVEQDPPIQTNDIPTVTQNDCDEEEKEPRLTESPDKDPDANQGKDKDKGKHPPVVSSFSTSSRDLDPYPPHLLSGHQHSRSTPPQIEHYDSNMAQTESQSSRRSKSISKQNVSFVDQEKVDA